MSLVTSTIVLKVPLNFENYSAWLDERDKHIGKFGPEGDAVKADKPLVLAALRRIKIVSREFHDPHTGEITIEEHTWDSTDEAEFARRLERRIEQEIKNRTSRAALWAFLTENIEPTLLQKIKLNPLAAEYERTYDCLMLSRLIVTTLGDDAARDVSEYTKEMYALKQKPDQMFSSLLFDFNELVKKIVAGGGTLSEVEKVKFFTEAVHAEDFDSSSEYNKTLEYPTTHELYPQDFKVYTAALAFWYQSKAKKMQTIWSKHKAGLWSGDSSAAIVNTSNPAGGDGAVIRAYSVQTGGANGTPAAVNPAAQQQAEAVRAFLAVQQNATSSQRTSQPLHCHNCDTAGHASGQCPYPPVGDCVACLKEGKSVKGHLLKFCHNVKRLEKEQRKRTGGGEHTDNKRSFRKDNGGGRNNSRGGGGGGRSTGRSNPSARLAIAPQGLPLDNISTNPFTSEVVSTTELNNNSAFSSERVEELQYGAACYVQRSWTLPASASEMRSWLSAYLGKPEGEVSLVSDIPTNLSNLPCGIQDIPRSFLCDFWRKTANDPALHNRESAPPDSDLYGMYYRIDNVSFCGTYRIAIPRFHEIDIARGFSGRYRHQYPHPYGMESYIPTPLPIPVMAATVTSDEPTDLGEFNGNAYGAYDEEDDQSTATSIDGLNCRMAKLSTASTDTTDKVTVDSGSAKGIERGTQHVSQSALVNNDPNYSVISISGGALEVTHYGTNGAGEFLVVPDANSDLASVPELTRNNHDVTFRTDGTLSIRNVVSGFTVHGVLTADNVYEITRSDYNALQNSSKQQTSHAKAYPVQLSAPRKSTPVTRAERKQELAASPVGYTPEQLSRAAKEQR